MWTEMENANIEKLCGYFSDKEVHQELTFSSQSTIFIPPLTTIFIFIIIDLHIFLPCFRVYYIPLLTTSTFSHQWSSWSHQLSSYNQTLFCHPPLLWGWFHRITLSMFFFLFYCYEWPFTFAYTALKSNRVHWEQHLLQFFSAKFRALATRKLFLKILFDFL